MFDDWQSIAWVAGSVLGAYGFVLWLGSVVWTYRDMSERTHDGWSQAVAVLLVLVFSVPGLFLYLILRPHETLAEAYERRLEAEALMRDAPAEPRSCRRCARPVQEDFLLCPHCRTNLREPCSGCGRALDLDWVACPYCGAQGPQAPVPVPEPLAAAPPAPADTTSEPSRPASKPAGPAAAGTRGAPRGGHSSS
jgi:RNA polymerase subunit RPABC4/transcription elongation factor Spt4